MTGGIFLYRVIRKGFRKKGLVLWREGIKDKEKIGVNVLR